MFDLKRMCMDMLYFILTVQLAAQMCWEGDESLSVSLQAGKVSQRSNESHDLYTHVICSNAFNMFTGQLFYQ